MVSSDYNKISAAEAERLYNESLGPWFDEDMPQKQWEINRQAFESMRNGKWDDVPPFKAFVEAAKATAKQEEPLKALEIGASSGYYGELLRLAGFRWDYTALDYSPILRKFAQSVYPLLKYIVADARQIPLPDGSFDVVISGCYLLHMFDWRRALAESARLTSNFLITSRTPLNIYSETKYFSKLAYDKPILEIHFNENEFYTAVESCGFKLVTEKPIFSHTEDGGTYGHYTQLWQRYE